MNDYQIAVFFSLLVLAPLAVWKVIGMVKKLQKMSSRISQ